MIYVFGFILMMIACAGLAGTVWLADNGRISPWWEGTALFGFGLLMVIGMAMLLVSVLVAAWRWLP